MARAIEDVDWGRLGGSPKLKNEYLAGSYTPPAAYLRTPAPPAPGAPAPGGGAPPAPFVNKAEVDPYLDANAKAVQDRIKNYGGTAGRAIDLAGSKLRDAAEGTQRAIESKYSRLGTFGGGQQIQAELESGYDTEGKIAQAGADIALGRERDLDSFMLNATGTLGAPGAAARGDRALAMQQWESEQAAARGREASDLARQMAILNALNSAPPVPAYVAPRAPATRSTNSGFGRSNSGLSGGTAGAGTYREGATFY